MPMAFVLITVELGHIEEVLQEIKKVESVKETYAVYGVYDVIAKIRAASSDEFQDLVVQRIRRISWVRSTLTMIVT